MFKFKSDNSDNFIDKEIAKEFSVINGLDWKNSDISQLGCMLENIRTAKKKVHKEVKQLREVLNNHLSSCQIIDPESAAISSFEFEQDYERIRLLEGKYNRLVQLWEKVNDAKQRKIIKEGIESNKWAQWLGKSPLDSINKIILVLIVVVFVILLAQMFISESSNSEEVAWKVLNDGLITTVESTQVLESIEENGLITAIGKPEVACKILYILYVLDWICCFFFLADYFLRRHYTKDKHWFARKNWHDLLSSFPVPPLEIFGVLTLGTPQMQWLRLIRLIRLFRAFRIASILWRGWEKVEYRVDTKSMKFALVGVFLTIMVGVISVEWIENDLQKATNQHIQYVNPVKSQNEIQRGDHKDQSKDLLNSSNDIIRIRERNQSSNTSKTLEGNGIWWGFNTVASGELVYEPRNKISRIISATMVLSGLILMSVFIATMVSALRGDDEGDLKITQRDLKVAIDELYESQQAIAEKVESISKGK